MRRYAIYFAPAVHTDLWAFGSSVLGFDAAARVDVPYPSHPLFDEPASVAYSAVPRRYGFHATLKAPFRLAAGRSEAELEGRLESFAGRQARFEVPLKLATFRDFFALVPDGPAPRLDRLAERCVRDFDDFRAPLTDLDRERRRPERLTVRERENLERWGYPFVLEDFRFHMTLTGSLDAADLVRLGPALHELFAVVSPIASIDAVSLFVQDDAGSRFRLHRRFSFTSV